MIKHIIPPDPHPPAYIRRTVKKSKMKFIPIKSLYSFKSDTECLIEYNQCFREAAENVWSRCINACYEKYKDPPQIEKYNKCAKICHMAAQAAYDMCGDEYAKCRGRDPRERQRFDKQQQKEAFGDTSMIMGLTGPSILGVGANIAMGATTMTVLAGVSIGALGIVLIIGALYMYGLKRDPVDNNFKSFARPRPPRPFLVRPKAGTVIDTNVAKAINALQKNQVNAVGLYRTIMTSINRAQGAAVAKEDTFEKLQMKNARKYAGRLAPILRQSAGLRSEAVTRLRENGAVFSITEDQAENLRGILSEKGLPYEFKSVLSRYGKNASERNEVLNHFVSQLGDVHHFELTFPDVLSTPELASAENRVASALEEFSESTSPNG